MISPLTKPVRAEKAKRTRLRPVNPHRKAKLYALQFGGPDYPALDYSAWIRERPCLVAGCVSGEKVEAHHAISRGAGGKWMHLVPLCSACHRDVHQIGAQTFQRIHSLDFRAVAAHLAAEYMEAGK